MKILEFNKKVMFILSIIFVAIACVLMYFNKLGYQDYLELKKEYVEVECTVIEVDETKPSVKVAWSYKNQSYEVVWETTQYKLMDQFTCVIKPEAPEDLRFDNGYSFWNIYTFISIALTASALVLDIIVIKRLFIRIICKKSEKHTAKVVGVKGRGKCRVLTVEHQGKLYKSELFNTFENIILLEANVVIDFYKKGIFHYIDLSTYKKVR
jgi:hypothetical protein